ncbi:MAG: hypothetical protein FWC91_14685 [Defluviitaleaceae bacterium]|nr:hypothetical protein [Defluviitaleaceae bacterium]
MDEQNFNRQCNKGIILFVLFWIGSLHILVNDYLMETMPLIVDIAIYGWASLGIVWGGATLITTMKIGCIEDFLESIDMFLRILSWVTIIVYCLNIASTIYLILVMRMIE